MTGIDDKIAEARELAAKFFPAIMNGAIPEREDFRKVCIMLREILEWIKIHDERRTVRKF
jgi:hypothetical protein